MSELHNITVDEIDEFFGEDVDALTISFDDPYVVGMFAEAAACADTVNPVRARRYAVSEPMSTGESLPARRAFVGVCTSKILTDSGLAYRRSRTMSLAEMAGTRESLTYRMGRLLFDVGTGIIAGQALKLSWLGWDWKQLKTATNNWREALTR